MEFPDNSTVTRPAAPLNPGSLWEQDGGVSVGVGLGGTGVNVAVGIGTSDSDGGGVGVGSGTVAGGAPAGVGVLVTWGSGSGEDSIVAVGLDGGNVALTTGGRVLEGANVSLGEGFDVD